MTTDIIRSAGRPVGRRADGWRTAARRYWPAIAALIFAVAYRAPTFGDPILEFDEQLYLTVGDRMLAGGLPYVDLWDRKPLGLFAIFAAIRLLGGEGVVQYQLVAALSAGATAALIYAMARRGAGLGASLLVAAAYILFLNPLHGSGGQAPVLYNLLTAAEAWLVLRAHDTTQKRIVIGCAAGTMILAGLAIQCKYTPVVEGVFFGLVLLARLRRIGIASPALVGIAAAMITLALSPTLLAAALYWRLNHLDAFMQANFLSIFSRLPFPLERRIEQRLLIAVIGGPLLAIAMARLVHLLRDRDRGPGSDARIVGGWCVAALIGFAMLGDVFDFYFISVLPPLLVFAAPLADRPGRMRAIMAGGLLVWPLCLAPPPLGVAGEHRRATMALVQAIEPLVGKDRCLYVYDGPTSLYLLTKACTASRFIYPDHLNNPVETPALGVDAVAEMTRLLATRPGAIVIADRPLVPYVDVATRAVLLDVLKRDYVRVARVEADRVFDVFALRSLHAGPGILAGAPIDPQ
ncbi:MAG TPA: hypothetical protein VM900_12265 [Sphingomonas sp.]|nr:hypothetical protein [Sphingomonas sp.]